MPRHSRRARSAPSLELRRIPVIDQPTESEPSLAQRSKRRPDDQLEALRAEIGICSPVLYVRLSPCRQGQQPYLHLIRGRKDERILLVDGVYRWESSGLEAGRPDGVAEVARAVARFMGAPVRTL